jgi:hypothetical protein
MPRLCANLSPSTSPTIAFALAVGVHHSGETETKATFDRETPQPYNRTISNPRDSDSERRTKSIEPAIRFNRECDSNEIDGRDSQDEKYDDPRISTFPGILIN